MGYPIHTKLTRYLQTGQIIGTNIDDIQDHIALDLICRPTCNIVEQEPLNKNSQLAISVEHVFYIKEHKKSILYVTPEYSYQICWLWRSICLCLQNQTNSSCNDNEKQLVDTIQSQPNDIDIQQLTMLKSLAIFVYNGAGTKLNKI